MRGLKVFAGSPTVPLARRICDELGIELGDSTILKFSNDNTFIKINENVRQYDVFVVQTSCPPVDQNLMEALIMIDALRRASAARITAVLPLYPYGRSDKKDQPRIPITARLVADLLMTAGADRVVTVDLHSPQIQGFFTIPLDHLTAGNLLVDYFLNLEIPDLVVVAPDAGAAKEADVYARWMNAPLAIMDKRRTANDDAAAVANFIGEIKGRNALIIDDEISTAGTIVEVVKALKGHGANKIYVGCTHPVFSGPAVDRLRNAAIEELVVTDTVPLPEHCDIPNLTVLSIAPLLAQAIKRIHEGQSVSVLFKR